jgi:hypothetical protein
MAGCVPSWHSPCVERGDERGRYHRPRTHSKRDRTPSWPRRPPPHPVLQPRPPRWPSSSAPLSHLTSMRDRRLLHTGRAPSVEQPPQSYGRWAMGSATESGGMFCSHEYPVEAEPPPRTPIPRQFSSRTVIVCSSSISIVMALVLSALRPAPAPTENYWMPPRARS